MPRMLTVWMDFSQRCQINEMAGSCAQTRTNCNNKSTTSNNATTGKLFSTDPNAVRKVDWLRKIYYASI